jgi:phosphoribosylformimino-5-aminoimidazole carboxamide ribotide isomerase
LRILPVVDLRQGQIVHAVGGQRAQYPPLTSCWSTDAHDPFRLLQALHARLGSQHFYVADLDALEGRPYQFDAILSLIQSGFGLWLDASIRSGNQAHQWLSFGAERLIVASETLPSLAILTEIAQQVDHQRIIVSLDFFQGTFRIPFAISAHDLIAQGLSLGLCNYIVLDTAQVGMNEGPHGLKFCLELKPRYPSLFLITGGGVRDRNDLDRLAEAGIDVVLVATALHQGRLNPSDFGKYPFV